MLKDQPDLSYLYSVRPRSNETSANNANCRRPLHPSLNPRRTPCAKPVDVVSALSHIIGDVKFCKTYSPGTGERANDTTRNHSGPETPRTLENRAGDRACGNAVGPVVLAAVVADGAVETVVHHRDHTGGVAEEGTSPCDGVEDGVQAQLGRRRGRESVQTLGETPCASHCKRAKIRDTGAVTQIIGPSSRGQEGVAVGKV